MDAQAALEAYNTNDIPVMRALLPWVGALDRGALLRARLSGTRQAAEEADAQIAREGEGSPLLREYFVARMFARLGAHEDALRTRLSMLPDCPRYDPWLSAQVLVGIAQSHLALGDGDAARPFAERALRILPLDPYALVTLADVLDAVGEAAGANSVRGWLYDRGAGPYLLADPPSDGVRDAAPYEPDVELEPMDDETVARYLVFARRDVGLYRTLAWGRRHIAVQLRLGDVGGARATAAYYAAGTPYDSDGLRWMGADVPTNSEFMAMAALAEEADRRPLSKAIKSPAKLYARHQAKRASEVEAQGNKGVLPRTMLLDIDWSVAREAALVLPNDPITVSAANHEKLCGSYGYPLFSGAPVPEDAAGIRGNGVVRGYLDDEGAPIVYPFMGAAADSDPYAPFIDRATTGRSKCAACKEAISPGELRMVLRGKAAPVQTRFVHASCGMHKRFKKQYEQALARSRH